MLTVIVPGEEFFNEATEEFYYTSSQTLRLEHSLVSISKWESKWKKVFLNDKPKSDVESLDYIRCMTLTQNVPLDVYSRIPPKVMKEIQEYMADSQSGTKLRKTNSKSKDVMSSEMIYYLMVANNIPVEVCQKWHINRLLTLLRICSIKNAAANGKKKRGRSEADIARSNRELNAARRAKMNSQG